MNDLNNRAGMQTAQLRQLLLVSNVSLVTSIVLAALLAYMLWEAVAYTSIMVWCSLMVLALLLRAVLIITYQRSPTDDVVATHARLGKFRLGVLVAGVVWGSAGILLFPANDLQHQMFLIFTLAGMTAGGVVSFSADLPSAILFSVSVIAPLMIRLFVAAESLSVTMGWALLLYLGFMIMSLRRINQGVRENICLRLEASERVEELLLKNQLSDDIINSLPGIFYIVNPQGRFVRVNLKLIKVSGYSRRELDSMTALDLFDGDDKSLIALRMQQAFEAGDSWAEAELITKTGQRITHHLTGHRTSIDGYSYVVGLGYDITERKLAEDEMISVKNKLQATLDAIPDVIFEMGLDGQYYECHSSHSEMLMMPADAFIDKSVHDIFPTDAADVVLQALREAHETGVSHDKQISLSRPQGIAWFEFSVSRKPVPAGQEPRFIVLSRDITERKNIENELHIAATAFESQEGMLISDTDNAILRVNQAFTDITGYTADEVIGQNPRMLSSGRQDANFYSAMWESINLKGSWKGEIWNRRKNGEIYPEHLSITAVKDQKGNITNYVASLTDITLHKESVEEIKHLAFYDPLTRLPNRRLLMDRLKQALPSSDRNGRYGAILFIDLDNFKTINDTLGHNIGDMLLQQVALRLESCVREGDTVARLGGDEFVVVLEQLSTEAIEAAAQTEAIGEKILATLDQPYLLSEHNCHNTPSIGAILFYGHQQTIDVLLQQVDIAMYQAKKAGRNALRFFDPQMQHSINTRAALEDELRRALANHQFHLYYQVQVDSSRRAVGAEALIRWTHPEHGLVSPAQFIQLAEDTGLILPIGLWVLDEGCAQLKKWQEDPLTCDLVLAINVSGKQFHQPDFIKQVRAAVQRHAINPLRLKLELTEGVVLENIEDAIDKLQTLKNFGVRISLDDFGTGYSSLSYLKRLPLDQVKIDQSFVRDIATDKGDVVLVRTIVDLGMNFELDVIAEGVENEAQFKLLYRYGCTGFQGYLFGKPMPVEKFEALVKQG